MTKCRYYNNNDYRIPPMEVSDKELRKMLNKAWTARENHHISWCSSKATRNSARYRDVSRIIKKAAKRGSTPSKPQTGGG